MMADTKAARALLPIATRAGAGEGEGEEGKGVGEGGKAATAANDRRPSVASTAAPHGRSSSLLLQQTGSLESIPEVSWGETSGVDAHAKGDPLSELGERGIEDSCRLSMEDGPESAEEWAERALTSSIEPWPDDDEEEAGRQQPPKATPKPPPRSSPTPAKVLPSLRRTKDDNNITYNNYPGERKSWWQRLRRALRVGCASCGARKPPRPRLPTAKVPPPQGDPLSELGERALTSSIEPWLDDDEEEAGRQQPPKATPKPPPRSSPTPAKVLPSLRRTKDDNNITYNNYPGERKSWWQRLRRALRVGCASCGARKPPRPRLPTAKVPPPQVHTTDRCPHLGGGGDGSKGGREQGREGGRDEGMKG
ncbi:unnamed protein product [Vitrella brassicaformis CCMP3155]|uniref:Uncharacterized protein n=1 Tax=Vitrella brassicaformis (strain CCMP3155) TaxID=1169540 RepID=A0A0G4H706_VITBC|nr:unnamed protein product [Vitrella brassicaformis CCMP3155]|eukprot:CEM39486.1 unnamed protein product [Vitrella brassicaformis CCMP3155]